MFNITEMGFWQSEMLGFIWTVNSVMEHVFNNQDMHSVGLINQELQQQIQTRLFLPYVGLLMFVLNSKQIFKVTPYQLDNLIDSEGVQTLENYRIRLVWNTSWNENSADFEIVDSDSSENGFHDLIPNFEQDYNKTITVKKEEIVKFIDKAVNLERIHLTNLTLRQAAVLIFISNIFFLNEKKIFGFVMGDLVILDTMGEFCLF